MPDINEPQIPDRAPSAPPLPKDLKSAGPPMTSIVPQAPDKVEEANRAMVEHESEPEPEDQPSDPETERQERIDYLRSVSNNQPKKERGNKWIIVVILVVVGLAVAAVAFWLLTKPKDHTPTSDTSASTASDTPLQQQPTDDAPANATTEVKEYESTNFPVTLKYPSDWTVSDTEAKLTFVSTPMKLTDNSGSTITGAIVVMIRDKQATLPEFKKGNATAVLESEHVKYTSPAPGQRDSTYLSFLQYAGTTVTGSLDAMYITGNAGYQKGQNVPQADVTKVDPLITVSFVECETKCADTDESLTVSSTVWTGDLKKTIETILESLQIS